MLLPSPDGMGVATVDGALERDTSHVLTVRDKTVSEVDIDLRNK